MLNGRISRFQVLLIVEMLVALALLPGCFGRARLVCEVRGEDIAAAPADGGVQYQGDPMELMPGVYQVQVCSHPGEGQSLYIDVLRGDGTFRSLRGNGVSVFAAQEYIDFDVYVTDRIAHAYVQCDIQGGGAELLESIKIYRTNRSSRKLFVLAILCFAALDGLLWWRRDILAGKVDRERQLVFWGLAGTVLLAYFPYLSDYFYNGADTFFHIMRIEALKESLEGGCPLPIRVQDYWAFGHGYAVSFFYGDLFLFIPALLRLTGFSLSFSYKAFVLLIIVATVVVAYVSLLKCVKDRYAALFGTVVYTLIPYRIFDFYSRGAIGECLAMAFMPLVCCAMYLLFTEDVDGRDYRHYKWYLAAGMSALLQSHLIATELTACFMVVVCVVLWRRTFCRQTFRELWQATAAVLVINCWFWLPMLYMMMIDRYRVSEIVSGSIQARGAYLAGMFQLLPNRGGYQEGMYNCEPVQAGAAVLLALVVYMGFILWTGRKMYRAEKWFVGLTLATLVLSLQYIPWDVLQGLPLIGRVVATMQFPTRLMMFSTVFAAMFAALLYKRLRAEGSRLFFRVSVFLIYAVAVGSCVYHVNDIAFDTEPVYLYTGENMGTMALMNGEYLLDRKDAADLYSHGPVAEEGLSWTGYGKRGTQVSIQLENRTGELRYLELPLIGYKGYAVELTEGEGEAPYLAEERGAHGDLRIAVPGGFQGTVRVWYKGFALFHVAEAVSGISLLVLSGYGLWNRYGLRNRRRQKC